MAITESSRHQLYQRLEEVLGAEQATTLMEHLPPVGWADVATKRDLDHAVEQLRSEWKIQGADLRAGFTAAMHKQTYTLMAYTTAIVIGAGFLR
jgi:hypothetical protein